MKAFYPGGILSCCILSSCIFVIFEDFILRRYFSKFCPVAFCPVVFFPVCIMSRVYLPEGFSPVVLRTFTTRGQSGVCPFCLATSCLEVICSLGKQLARDLRREGSKVVYYLLGIFLLGNNVAIMCVWTFTITPPCLLNLYFFFFISNALLFMKFIYI